MKKENTLSLQETADKSMEIRRIYHTLEKEIHGKEWNSEEDALAFLTDAALVGRQIMVKEGRWPSSEESMIPDKIGECVWWLAILADMGASLAVVFNGLRLLRAPTTGVVEKG